MTTAVPDFLFTTISQKTQRIIDNGGTIQDAVHALIEYDLSDELIEFFVDYAITANKMSRLTDDEFCAAGAQYCKLMRKNGLCEAECPDCLEE